MTDEPIIYQGIFNATPEKIAQALRAYTKRRADEVGGYHILLEPYGNAFLVQGVPDEYFNEIIEDPIFINTYGTILIDPVEGQSGNRCTLAILGTGTRLDELWYGYIQYLQTQFLEVLPEPDSPEEMESHQNPWQSIDEQTGWDREALKMWWEGYKNKEIAEKVNVVPRRVTNRISELRKKYNPEIVPYKKDRDQFLRNRARDNT